MKKAGKKVLKTILIILAALIVFCVVAGVIGYRRSRSGGGRQYIYTPEVRTISGEGTEGIGAVSIATLPLNEKFVARRAVYTFSGSVLISYNDGIDSVICVLQDDGSQLRELYRGVIKSSYRLLPFADNRRVLLGDYILECPEGTDLDTCPENSAVLIPVEFPEAFWKNSNVTDRWTEVIVSQDCSHIAWTIRRKDCGAVNAMGTLTRGAEKYTISDAAYISNMTPLVEDPEHPGYSVYTPVIGGEVKQFVRGGAAISLVGGDICGMADSVLQDVATGEVTQLTFAPGYDETTILSPDEKLGITMTTRFSGTTDMAILGLVPRPFGQPLHNILGQVYMYGVTGVRSGRDGNIGPALIDLSRSMTQRDYRGINLSDPTGEWVYLSPMSWKNDSTKAMWLEKQRNGKGYRVQIVTLLEYAPEPAVETVATPAVGTYAAAPAKTADYDTVVLGKASGSAHLVKKSGFLGSAAVTVVYDHFSDDGVFFYNGTETSSGSVMSKTNYESNVEVTDAEGNMLGEMQLTMQLGAAYSLPNLIEGNNSPHLDTKKSKGFAQWQNQSADIAQLVE